MLYWTSYYASSAILPTSQARALQLTYTPTLFIHALYHTTYVSSSDGWSLRHGMSHCDSLACCIHCVVRPLYDSTDWHVHYCCNSFCERRAQLPDQRRPLAGKQGVLCVENRGGRSCYSSPPSSYILHFPRVVYALYYSGGSGPVRHQHHPAHAQMVGKVALTRELCCLITDK